MSAALPFWRTKSLDAMTRAEWESLCDGCGRCCLHKLRDNDTGRLYFTEVACRLLDTATARCSDYADRKARVPDCVKLTPAKLKTIDWLPPTCGYRLVAEGRDLPWWHPLVSGTQATVAQAGVSVAGRAVRERDADALEEHVARWPGQVPRRARPLPEPRSPTKDNAA
ncbi:MAG: YcgN family cysteine cluster protein [Acetobacteraceae bacterium]|nr:YcgN family cysteine cluster protein [Acetobacteraceae bacterium]